MKHKFLVPIITPFTADESVNYESLTRLTKAVLLGGADGIYAGGSSAECFLLTEDERKKTLETVIKAANGAYVVAHVGAISAHNSVELARHAKAAGANAIASVPPFYFAYPFEGVLEYYRRLAEVGLPVIVYSLPSATRKLTIDEYKALMSIDGVIGLKYTDTDYFTMQQIIAASGAEVYSGKDECFLSALSMGAHGAIGSTFNFMLEAYPEIYRLYKAKKTDEALAVQSAANAVTAVCIKNLLPAMKYLATLRYGIDCGIARCPFTPLTPALESKLKTSFETYLASAKYIK